MIVIVDADARRVRALLDRAAETKLEARGFTQAPAASRFFAEGTPRVELLLVARTLPGRDELLATLKTEPLRVGTTEDGAGALDALATEVKSSQPEPPPPPPVEVVPDAAELEAFAAAQAQQQAAQRQADRAAQADARTQAYAKVQSDLRAQADVRSRTDAEARAKTEAAARAADQAARTDASGAPTTDAPRRPSLAEILQRYRAG